MFGQMLVALMFALYGISVQGPLCGREAMFSIYRIDGEFVPQRHLADTVGRQNPVGLWKCFGFITN